MLKLLNKLVFILLVVAFLAAIGLFMISYTIRYTETGVVTTFGAASEASVVDEPGLHWKLPFAQSVTKYDRRVRLVRARSETQQTADDFQIVVEAYMTYRVTDPLKFFQRFSSAGDRATEHYRKAENDVLRDRLRAQLGETSTYRIDDLFTPERGASRLPELEQRIFDKLAAGGSSGLGMGEYGIEVVTVGIDRVVLPEGTTTKVMDRMGANRDRLAERYESEGDSQAKSIIAGAESDAAKILAFATRKAAEIERRGLEEAAPYLAQQMSNERLAVFLRELEFVKQARAKQVTLILSTSDFGLGIFHPDTIRQLEMGTIPSDASRPRGER